MAATAPFVSKSEPELDLPDLRRTDHHGSERLSARVVSPNAGERIACCATHGHPPLNAATVKWAESKGK
jgi:hypothetical protein